MKKSASAGSALDMRPLTPGARELTTPPSKRSIDDGIGRVTHVPNPVKSIGQIRKRDPWEKDDPWKNQGTSPGGAIKAGALSQWQPVVIIKNAESVGKALSSAVTTSPESCIGSIATIFPEVNTQFHDHPQK